MGGDAGKHSGAVLYLFHRNPWRVKKTHWEIILSPQISQRLNWGKILYLFFSGETSYSTISVGGGIVEKPGRETRSLGYDSTVDTQRIRSHQTWTFCVVWCWHQYHRELRAAEDTGTFHLQSRAAFGLHGLRAWCSQRFFFVINDFTALTYPHDFLPSYNSLRHTIFRVYCFSAPSACFNHPCPLFRFLMPRQPDFGPSFLRKLKGRNLFPLDFVVLERYVLLFLTIE